MDIIIASFIEEVIVPKFNYWIYVILMMIGLYNVMASSNLVKKLIGLGIFQSAVFLMYISMGKILGGTAPIANNNIQTFSNPLPHVLILTAIVVGIATTAVGLAIAIRIKEAYGSIEEYELIDTDQVNI